jgi:hypothetical protein
VAAGLCLEHPVAAAGAAMAGAAEDEGVVHLEVAEHLSEGHCRRSARLSTSKGSSWVLVRTGEEQFVVAGHPAFGTEEEGEWGWEQQTSLSLGLCYYSCSASSSFNPVHLLRQHTGACGAWQSRRWTFSTNCSCRRSAG